MPERDKCACSAEFRGYSPLADVLHCLWAISEHLSNLPPSPIRVRSVSFHLSGVIGNRLGKGCPSYNEMEGLMVIEWMNVVNEILSG